MKKISFLLVYLLTSVIVCAQHKKISGTITGTQNETIIGATVLEKGTTNGVVTDIDGKFSIQLTNDNATLVISYIGYKTQEIKPQGNTLSIQMESCWFSTAFKNLEAKCGSTLFGPLFAPV